MHTLLEKFNKKGVNKSTIKPEADLLTPSTPDPAKGPCKFLIYRRSILCQIF